MDDVTPAPDGHDQQQLVEYSLSESAGGDTNIFDLQYSSRLERDYLNKRKVEWASRQTMSSVEFNDEFTEVVKIGTRPVEKQSY